MPRYFFHRTDGYVENDQSGIELSGLPQARLEAIRFAGQSLSEDPEMLWQNQEFRVEVTNESGAVVMTVIVVTVDQTPRQWIES